MSDVRRTRFHDEKGNRVTLAEMYFAPHALISTALLKTVRYRQAVPWISYRARKQLERLMHPTWSVLEFGSGMSTVWLAQRCATLYSVEHDSAWYKAVQEQVAARRLSHVQHMLREGDSYSNLSAFPSGSFDLVLIDGIERAECAEAALGKLKRGGWIYLDNSDRAGDFRQAEQILLRAARQHQRSVQYFTDFAPASFVVCQGMLVQL